MVRVPKHVITILCAFIGATAGIFAGWWLLAPDKPEVVLAPADRTPMHLPEMNFYLGDSFPDERFSTLTGDSLTTQQLLSGKPAVILFVEPQCQECMNLLNFWQKSARKRLRPEIQIIALMDSQYRLFAQEQQTGLLHGIRPAFFDYTHWAETYLLNCWPVIVQLDRTGRVANLQYGFSGRIDKPILEQVTTAT